MKGRYDRIARFYDLFDLPWEILRYRKIRPEIFRIAGEAMTARGSRLLDVGVGTGRNIRFYPPLFSVGIDLSGEMLRVARLRVGNRSVALLQGDSLRLPFFDATFDAAAATFLFCVLSNEAQSPALEELIRVVKPGGKIVLLDYHYPEKRSKRLVMQMFAPLVERLYGARFDRPTAQAIAESGLKTVEERPMAGGGITLRILLKGAA